jgi:hypothetical protein
VERLVIDKSSSEQRLAHAAELLERCDGVVVLEGVVTLWPSPHGIECSVTGSSQAIARCEEEYKVLVENAARALEASTLGSRLPNRPLHWVIVAEYGTGAVELWRAP